MAVAVKNRNKGWSAIGAASGLLPWSAPGKGRPARRDREQTHIRRNELVTSVLDSIVNEWTLSHDEVSKRSQQGGGEPRRMNDLHDRLWENGR